MDTAQIIESAEEFIYYDDDLTERIESWAVENCASFSNEISEHPLQHTSLFEEYCQLFEDIMEKFLNDKDITLLQFHSAIREDHECCVAKHVNLTNSSLASMLISSIDFDSFCDMMNDVREGKGVVFCPPLVPIDNDDDISAQDDSVGDADAKFADMCIVGNKIDMKRGSYCSDDKYSDNNSEEKGEEKNSLSNEDKYHHK